MALGTDSWSSSNKPRDPQLGGNPNGFLGPLETYRPGDRPDPPPIPYTGQTVAQQYNVSGLKLPQGPSGNTGNLQTYAVTPYNTDMSFSGLAPGVHHGWEPDFMQRFMDNQNAYVDKLAQMDRISLRSQKRNDLAGIDANRASARGDWRNTKAQFELDREIGALLQSVTEGNLADLPRLRELAARKLSRDNRGYDQAGKDNKANKKMQLFNNAVNADANGSHFGAGTQIREGMARQAFRSGKETIAIGREESADAYQQRLMDLASQERGYRADLASGPLAAKRLNLDEKKAYRQFKNTLTQYGIDEQDVERIWNTDRQKLRWDKQKQYDDIFSSVLMADQELGMSNQDWKVHAQSTDPKFYNAGLKNGELSAKLRGLTSEAPERKFGVFG